MLGLNWFEQIVLNLSTCLNVLSSCHVIGWLDIRINKQKEKYYRELIKGIVHFNLMHERIRLLSGEVSSLLRLVFIVMSYQKSCVFFNVLLCFFCVSFFVSPLAPPTQSVSGSWLPPTVPAYQLRGNQHKSRAATTKVWENVPPKSFLQSTVFVLPSLLRQLTILLLNITA